MKTVSVINYKGGVGKTTVVANISAELAYRGHRVLLIDLDPQASLTFSLMTVEHWADHYAAGTTIRNWYDAYVDEDQNLALDALVIAPRISRQLSGTVNLICSHLSLINIDLELAARLSGGTMRQTRTNFLRLHSRLRDGLDSAAIQDNYDYVIIDCPPNFNIVTKTAIVASDRILIPAIPDFLSTLGIDELRRHIDELTTDFNGFASLNSEPSFPDISPSVMGVVPTMIRVYANRPIAAQQQYINRMRQTQLPVFDSYVRRNDTVFGRAPEYGVPVVLGDASVNREELEQLTTEFLSKV